MGNKTVMVAAWILMLMVIVEVPGTTFAVTEVVDEVAVVDEVGYSVRLLKAVVAPLRPLQARMVILQYQKSPMKSMSEGKSKQQCHYIFLRYIDCFGVS